MGGPFGKRPNPPGRMVPRAPSAAQLAAYQRETAAIVGDIKKVTEKRQMPHVMEACVQILAQIALMVGLPRETFLADCGRAYDAYQKLVPKPGAGQ